MSGHPITKILNENRLEGPNFNEWLRNLKIVLTFDKIVYVLQDAPPHIPLAANATNAQRVAYQKHKDDDTQAKCVMLASMNPQLQKQHENMESASAILLHLTELFGERNRNVRFSVVNDIVRTKQVRGAPVHQHGLKMIGLIEQIQDLGFALDAELAQDLLLSSLDDSFSQFIMNYNMQQMNHTLAELLNMLVTAEKQIKKESGSIAIASSTKFKSKDKGKGKKKQVVKPKGGIQKKKKEQKKPKGICFFCNKEGHWKRNCKAYLASLKKNKSSEEGMINVIESVLTVNNISTWILDSGASHHVCTSLQELVGARKLKAGEIPLRVGNGTRVDAKAVGTYLLKLPSGETLELKNCLYLPVCIKNLISVSMLLKDGYRVVFDKLNGSVFMNKRMICHANVNDGLFPLFLDASINCVKKDALGSKRSRETVNPIKMWHLKLGHISQDRIHKLSKDGYLESLGSDPMPTCESCLKGKMTKTPFGGQRTRVTELLGLIHTDVCGPMSTISRGGFSYFITFTDDYSRFGYVYLMKNKSEAFEKFKEFKNEVEKQTGKSIKALRSDRGGEYLSNEFIDYLKQEGIVSSLAPPGTPQLNGVSERRNRTLLDMVRSMMSYTDLPISFWGYALQTAIYLLNKVPSKSVPLTPYEMWHGKKPSLNHIKIWGCPAYVKILEAGKLEARSSKCLFVGYPKNSLGYYFYQPEEQKVFVSRYATFLERDYVLDRNVEQTVELKEVSKMPQVNTSLPDDQIPKPTVAQTPRRSSRIRIPPTRYGLRHESLGELNLLGDNESLQDPSTYNEAMSDIDSKKWHQAMESEMDSMYTNQVWTLVDPPPGIRPIGNKWVFKRKIGSDGKIETYKARLVAKGYKQREGIDYEDTFSPVAMVKSIRILLAIAAHYDYEIWQMDVKTAFLNGNLEEDLYMDQPEGFVSKDNIHKVCKLNRSIYGLKQASRSWNIRFDDAVKSFGFTQNMDEPCVYKKVSGSAVVFLVLYVDDILLIGNDVGMLSSVKVWLSKTFLMKDLGEASYVLGIKIYRDRSRRLIGLSQSLYIDKVLNRFHMENSKKGFLPVRHGIHLSKEMCPQTIEEVQKMSKIPYASAIGSLMYAMLCTRPDISYGVSITSRYQSNPGIEHWNAVKNILKYLRRTKDLFLVYGGGDLQSELQVEAYTDSDFQSDVNDSKSTSGFVFTLNGGAVSWRSRKQSVTADSTTEAEYIAAAEAAKEAVWMKKFITELDVVPTIESPIPLYCDNNGAIAQAKEPRSHQKSKHIRRRFHLIREFVKNGDIDILKVASVDNIADPFTKPLSQVQLERHLEKMGVRFMADWV